MDLIIAMGKSIQKVSGFGAITDLDFDLHSNNVNSNNTSTSVSVNVGNNSPCTIVLGGGEKDQAIGGGEKTDYMEIVEAQAECTSSRPITEVKQH